MFHLFKRSSETPPSEDDGAPAYRDCCREIHRLFLATEDGAIERDVFLSQKLLLLKAAVKDAETQGEGAELVKIVGTLRLARAVNDVELQSVTRHFGK